MISVFITVDDLKFEIFNVSNCLLIRRILDSSQSTISYSIISIEKFSPSFKEPMSREMDLYLAQYKKAVAKFRSVEIFT